MEKQSRKSDYAPACANAWRTGLCEKLWIKCADCDQHRTQYAHVPPLSENQFDWLTKATTRSTKFRPRLKSVTLIPALLSLSITRIRN